MALPEYHVELVDGVSRTADAVADAVSGLSSTSREILELLEGLKRSLDSSPDSFCVARETADCSAVGADSVLTVEPSEALVEVGAALGALDRDLKAVLSRHREPLQKALSAVAGSDGTDRTSRGVA